MVSTPGKRRNVVSLFAAGALLSIFSLYFAEVPTPQIPQEPETANSDAADRNETELSELPSTAAQLQGLIAAGYSKKDISPTGRGFSIANYPVQNELFLDPVSSDPLIIKINDILRRLDVAVMSDPGVKTQRIRGKGQGRSGRGWGISSPFTNKWQFYVKLLQTSRAEYMCEVGFLAGHSAGILIAANPHIKQLFEFDFKQPHTRYWQPAAQFFEKSFPDVFQIRFGKSHETVPRAISRGELRKCDFISLDGSKAVRDFAADLIDFQKVSDKNTVILCDDMSPHEATKPGKPSIVHDHHDVVRWLVSTGHIQIVDYFISDVKSWPKFGVLAIKYTFHGNLPLEIKKNLLSVYNIKKDPNCVGCDPQDYQHP